VTRRDAAIGSSGQGNRANLALNGLAAGPRLRSFRSRFSGDSLIVCAPHGTVNEPAGA